MTRTEAIEIIRRRHPELAQAIEEQDARDAATVRDALLQDDRLTVDHAGTVRAKRLN